MSGSQDSLVLQHSTAY